MNKLTENKLRKVIRKIIKEEQSLSEAGNANYSDFKTFIDSNVGKDYMSKFERLIHNMSSDFYSAVNSYPGDDKDNDATFEEILTAMTEYRP